MYGATHVERIKNSCIRCSLRDRDIADNCKSVAYFGSVLLVQDRTKVGDNLWFGLVGHIVVDKP